LDLLSAYDKTQDELFINVADYLAVKMIRVSQEDYVIINALQIKKRRQALDIEDEETLENILNQTDRLDIKCAVNILLDNKHLAKKQLAELAPDIQKSFRKQPLYALMSA
jgi:hypothetical protein